LALLPNGRQNLLFSATFSDDIKNLANGLLNSPERIEVARKNIAAESIKQVVHPVDSKRKGDLLSFLISSGKWKQVLVFTRTKHGANKLTEKLLRANIKATAIHGNKSQGARTKALSDFKNGAVSVLVATDIAARGLDIDELPHVVNFELPHVAEDYVHRIGRTGRAGKEGTAVSLVCVDELRLLKDIERLVKHDIQKEIVPGYQPDPTIKAEPIQKGRFSQNSDRRPAGKTKTSDRFRGSRREKSEESAPQGLSRSGNHLLGKVNSMSRSRASEGKNSFFGNSRSNTGSRLKRPA
jgi:ATP-dependent RNA helicase RhlE